MLVTPGDDNYRAGGPHSHVKPRHYYQSGRAGRTGEARTSLSHDSGWSGWEISQTLGFGGKRESLGVVFGGTGEQGKAKEHVPVVGGGGIRLVLRAPGQWDSGADQGR